MISGPTPSQESRAGHVQFSSRNSVRATLLSAGAAILSATAVVTATSGDVELPPPGLDMARLIEWNCPLTGEEVQVPPPDPMPGGLVADGNFVWFVTRAQPRLVRFLPGYPKATGVATCNWWDLDPLTLTTGGLRLKPWSTQVFVRGILDMQRVETTANRRTRWEDGIRSLADVAISSSYSSLSVYTTGTLLAPIGTLPGSVIEDPTAPLLNTGGVVQRLTPGSNGTATVKRWEVAPSVGSVELSGVDVHPLYANKVYFSEPFENTIGELDTNTSMLRRWSLSQLSPDVSVPRQLDVSYSGVIALVTLSGHIVRLNPSTGEAAAYPIPTGGIAQPVGNPANNPVGVDADGIIGFTASGFIDGFNKVGFLSAGTPLVSQTLTATLPTKAFAETLVLNAVPAVVPQFTGPARPVVKNVPATEASVNGGIIIEANIDMGTFEDMPPCIVTPQYPDDPCVASRLPHAVSNDPKGPVGSYYTSIGSSFLRIAHVSLPLPAGGLLSGNGYVALTDPITGAAAGTGYFTLDASKSSPTAAPRGSVALTYPDGKVISMSLTRLTFSGNSATIEGVCKTGSSCTTFNITVHDNGWSNDAIQIVRDPVLGVGIARGGTVTRGNIKVYRYQ